MIFLFIFTFAILGICQAFVSYLSGIHQQLVNPTKICSVNPIAIHDDLISFGDTFAKPLKSCYLSGNMRWQSQIITLHWKFMIQLKFFYLKFQCFANYRQISHFQIKWVAFDDDRIKVINKRIDVSMTVPKTITETHGIKNANKGFISILSFTFGGIQNYQINNLQITGDKVSVVYTPAADSTLTNIGFQIVVGTDLMFDILKDQSTGKIINGSPYYLSVSNIPDKILQIPIQGYHWATTTSYLNLLVGLNTPLTLCTIKVNAVAPQTPEFENIWYQKLWINTNKFSVPCAFLYQKMRITKKKYSNGYSVQLKIDELIQYFYPGNLQQFILDPTIQTFNMVSSMVCPQGYKIVGYVLYSLTPMLQNFDISTNCYRGINFVEHHIRLFQKDSVYQQIQISVSTTKITVTELQGDPSPINNMTLLSLELVIA